MAGVSLAFASTLPLFQQDGANVMASLPAGATAPVPGQIIEVLGTGTATGAQGIRLVQLGETFALDKYELLVQAIHGAHKALFM